MSHYIAWLTGNFAFGPCNRVSDLQRSEAYWDHTFCVIFGSIVRSTRKPRFTLNRLGLACVASSQNFATQPFDLPIELPIFEQLLDY